MPNYLSEMLIRFILCFYSTNTLYLLLCTEAVKAQLIIPNATLSHNQSTTLNNNIFVTEGISVELINTINRIAQICSTQARNNSFTIIGRGGLPASSKEVLNITPTWIDWRVGRSEEIVKKFDEMIQTPLVEATWRIDTNGIKLTASTSQILSHYRTLSCNAMGERK